MTPRGSSIVAALAALCFWLHLEAALGSPSHYWAKAPHAVRHAYHEMQTQKLGMQGAVEALSSEAMLGAELGGPASSGEQAANPCGQPIPGQKMWFANAGRCSIASADMMYFTHNNTLAQARKGEIVEMNCDSVECPVRTVRDCYSEPDICSSDEWCWIEEHEKYGPWAMGFFENGTSGYTPNMEYCARVMGEYKAAMAKNLRGAKLRELEHSVKILCPSNSQWDDTAWKPARGQCVPYRKEQQSCFVPQSLEPAFSGKMAPRFKFGSDGRPLERPLVCAPELACTGPTFNVLPMTCVEKRPKDICYYGPWWDSSDCPRDKAKRQGPGLSYEIVENAILNALVLFPGEVAYPDSCEYWDRTSKKGQEARRVRKTMYKILGALWPQHLLERRPPTLRELEALLPDPFMYLMSKGHNASQASALCPDLASTHGSAVAKLLAKGGELATQPNKVWSLVHFTTFNLQDPVRHEQALASQALATLLAQNFWCNDCRGFFEIGVISQFGLPPVTHDGMEIARWWWHGHNVASEHVATTRAGHPWIYQLGALKEYQNPFFMSWEDAHSMWHVSSEVAETEEDVDEQRLGEL